MCFRSYSQDKIHLKMLRNWNSKQKMKTFQKNDIKYSYQRQGNYSGNVLKLSWHANDFWIYRNVSTQSCLISFYHFILLKDNSA